MEHVGGVDVPSDLDGEPRVRELVKHGQQVQRTPVMGPGRQEVVGPYVAAMRGRRRMQDPSVSQSRPRFGWRRGTTALLDARSTPPAWGSRASPPPAATP